MDQNNQGFDMKIGQNHKITGSCVAEIIFSLKQKAFIPTFQKSI